MPLEACRSCSRHIRITESVCPFCAAPVLAGFAERSRRRVLPVGRIGRAAFLAWGTTVGALACADGAGNNGDNSGAPSSITVPDESEAAATLTPIGGAAGELDEHATAQARQAQQAAEEAEARAARAEEAVEEAEARAEQAAEAAAEASPMRRRRRPRMRPEGGNVPLYGSPSF